MFRKLEFNELKDILENGGSLKLSLDVYGHLHFSQLKELARSAQIGTCRITFTGLKNIDTGHIIDISSEAQGRISWDL